MSHSVLITRANPGYFVILVDQSGSMSEPLAGNPARSKADAVAEAVNALIDQLIGRSRPQGKILDYFSISVVGYGEKVSSAFGGELAGAKLVSITKLAASPIRSGECSIAGPRGDIHTSSRPIYYDAIASGPTPMCRALAVALDLCRTWIAGAGGLKPFPPIVLNITDGQSSDGDPSGAAQKLCQLKTPDGNVLLFNLHLSSSEAAPVAFPDEKVVITDVQARHLFQMSSVLPESFLKVADEMKLGCTATSRGFVFNSDIRSLTNFLNLGTLKTKVLR